MIELLPSDRLLVRMPAWLGDFVMAEPVARAAEELLAAGRLAGVGLAGPARLLALLEERAPALARLPTDGGIEPRAWRGHDVALLLDGSWRSALAALRAGIPERAGLARGGRGPLLTVAARPALERGGTPLWLGRHGRFPRALPRPFGSVAAELAGWIGLELRERRPRLAPTEAGMRAARARLARLGLAGEAYVIVNGGARPGSAKGAPPELLGPLVAGLCGKGERVLLACGPGEEAAARAVQGAAGAGAFLLDAPPPELAELVALISGARLVVTADSGPRHLAVALGRPVVVAFGPTDPRHTADQLGDVRGLRAPVPCGPCHRERCPLAPPGRHACWHRLAPQDLLAAAAELLAPAPRAGIAAGRAEPGATPG